MRKRLSHISHGRVKRLEKEDIIPPLKNDFINCEGIVKGKMMMTKRIGTLRTQKSSWNIHINTCGPFSAPSLSGQQCLISFFVDFSQFLDQWENMCKRHVQSLLNRNRKTTW